MPSFSLRAQQELHAQGAAQRRESFPCAITIGEETEQVFCAKSPTKITRQPNEHGSGYVQRAIATFMTPPTLATRPGIGSEFTVASSTIAADVGTQWRVFEFTPGHAGEEDRSVCFRLD